MFITVMFGAGCWELVNPWCNLVTLTSHLRQRGRVPPDATIALLAEDGHLVNLDEGLEEGVAPAESMASSLLQERGTYVLVQIISKAGLPPAMSPSWRTWMTSVQSWQRSCAGCRASQGARAGGGAWAHAVATRSKDPLQGPEGWAPCQGQECPQCTAVE
uniref:Uncharacterized protein n=1 Tax=Microcebus murinus TaxID=30608 RepID=A0A8C5UPF2_MICMU